MNYFKFNGIITAVATPFKNNELDLIALEKMLLSQLDARVNAILLFGTTGEGLSLSLTEKKILFNFARHVLKDKIPIICAISSPITKIAVAEAITYERWKANGILAITPYYYKTTERGIYEHFTEICNSTSLPVIAYNVPKRTCCDISKMDNLLVKLEKLKNLVGIKHCPNSFDECSQILNKTAIPIYCGSDKFLYDCLKLGYCGAISVFSNCLAKSATDLYNLAINNDFIKASVLFDKINDFINLIDTLPNPICIKHALSIQFNCSNELRLPLMVADEETQNKINQYYINLRS